MIRPVQAAILAALTAAPADAQSPLDAIGDAADKLTSVAADRLLIADYLGMDLTGSDGEAVGTVRDFVAIPGGSLVAALVEIPDGTRIAVPWEMMALESADGKAIRATQAAADLTGSQKLVDLASQLSD